MAPSKLKSGDVIEDNPTSASYKCASLKLKWQMLATRSSLLLGVEGGGLQRGDFLRRGKIRGRRIPLLELMLQTLNAHRKQDDSTGDVGIRFFSSSVWRVKPC